MVLALRAPPIQLILPTITTTTTLPSATTHPAFASLSQLEKFETLGRGSMGSVFKVLHKSTGSFYALKTYNNSANHKDVLGEIKILESIGTDCCFITKFNGTVFDDSAGDLSILMEYMDAGSLQSLVKNNGTLSETVIANVARQVLMGLDYLHNTKHVVHCDIKPANLLVNRNMEVKLADFGVSKVIETSDDQCQVFSGTTAYMAPERFDRCSYGDQNIDVFAGDIWSFGLTLMEVYTGYQAYSNKMINEFDLLYEVCYQDSPRLPDDASATFKDFVGCCLRKNPSERWTASELLGMNQAGLAECIVRAVNSCHPLLQPVLYESITLTGGSTLFPRFTKRLERELRPLVPDNYQVKITTQEDPLLGVWRGGSLLASSPDFQTMCVTKAEYEELGSFRCRKRFHH